MSYVPFETGVLQRPGFLLQASRGMFLRGDISSEDRQRSFDAYDRFYQYFESLEIRGFLARAVYRFKLCFSHDCRSIDLKMEAIIPDADDTKDSLVSVYFDQNFPAHILESTEAVDYHFRQMMRDFLLHELDEGLRCGGKPIIAPHKVVRPKFVK